LRQAGTIGNRGKNVLGILMYQLPVCGYRLIYAFSIEGGEKREEL
jgi:hypothetical protein